MHRFLARRYSTASYFQLFPKTFANGHPPATLLSEVNRRQLRSEFRQLQLQHHPDVAGEELLLSTLNKAYATLSDPLLLAQYTIKTAVPPEFRVDLTGDDSVGKRIIAKDKAFLMAVLETHEMLEDAEGTPELEALAAENDERIEQCVARLDELFKKGDYQGAVEECVRLKYWHNLKGSIYERE